jgi:uncharacterized protein (TIGR02001 family)
MKFCRFAIVSALLASTGAQAADFSMTGTVTSDYRYRGISQTAGDWAVQGSFDMALDNGFYAGFWASNVDFDDDANIEIDYYAGYTWEFNEGAGLDLMLNYYTYPGYSENADYLEIIPSLYFGDFTLLYAYAPDYFNTGDSAHYVSGDYSWEFAESLGVFEGLALDAHAGWSFGDYWDEWDIGDYGDFSVGVSASWGWAGLSLAYLFNSVDNAEEVSNGAFRNDDTLLFTITSTYDF